jgi:MoxR-like ATPase
MSESALITQLRACMQARVNVLLTGRPGIGKSRLAHLVAAAGFNDRVFAIVLPEDTPVAELRGHFLPKGDEFIWHDGPVTRAIKEGTACILDELSHLSPEAQTFMHAAMDDSPITLPTGETVKKTAKPWFIATQNDESEALRPALKDRFPVVLRVGNPVKEAYLGLPSELQKAAQKDVEGNKASLRPWYAFKELRTHMTDAAAAELIWPGRGEALVQAIKLAA